MAILHYLEIRNQRFADILANANQQSSHRGAASGPDQPALFCTENGDTLSGQAIRQLDGYATGVQPEIRLQDPCALTCNEVLPFAVRIEPAEIIERFAVAQNESDLHAGNGMLNSGIVGRLPAMQKKAVACNRWMRVVHTILSAGFAGSERATAEMCNAHCRAHDVLLVVRRDHRRYGASIIDHLDPALEVVEVSGWWPKAGLKAALERFRPDVVHAHLRRSTRLLARIGHAAPTVATLHLSWNGPHFAAMEGIICIADWQLATIPSDYRGKVFRISESYIPNRRLDAAECMALRAEMGAEPEDYVIGAVGRLARSKGFDLLVRAFKRARLPQARLVIIGDGSQRRRIRRQLDGNISLLGYRSNAKDYYQAFDLFVCSSRSEPLGRVLLEAYDAGLPVIATRTLGPTELVRNHGGELVAVDDELELAAALQRHFALRTAPERADLCGYHIDVIAEQTLNCYVELVDRFQQNG